MNNTNHSVVIGAGLGGLTAAALLAKKGMKPLVLERNWIPGGCATSYPRKHFIFESGATTLVGLDPGMALHTLLEELNISVEAIKLDPPMQVILADGEKITRYADKNEWIGEAERVFGKKGQRPFWNLLFRLSDFVWRVSGKYLHFPPTNVNDLWALAKKMDVRDIPYLRYAFVTTEDILRKYGLADNSRFVRFCNEQLLISAQNHVSQVNALFGAAALCYTQCGNYYLPGGMGVLSDKLSEYITQHGGKIKLRTEVLSIQHRKGVFTIKTRDEQVTTPLLFSGIPLNNLAEMDQTGGVEKYRKYLFNPENLYSAFQVGIAFTSDKKTNLLHYQIHCEKPFKGTEADSLFVSLSHPDDTIRSKEGVRVASVSMHIRNPHLKLEYNKEELEQDVLNELEKQGFLKKEDVLYMHSSQQKSWEKWTGRKWGFVGGYPQFKNIKPWQMKDARHPVKGFYLCGDTVYPGQGIPGVVLSGLVSVAKAETDGYI